MAGRRRGEGERSGLRALTLAERKRLARMLMHSADTLTAGANGQALTWETLAKAVAGERMYDATYQRVLERLTVAEVEWGVQ